MIEGAGNLRNGALDKGLWTEKELSITIKVRLQNFSLLCLGECSVFGLS